MSDKVIRLPVKIVEPEITAIMCGPRKCEHLWDGPQQEFDEGRGMTATCSKCGEWAINVSMWEGP